jgi:hypothetical protein
MAGYIWQVTYGRLHMAGYIWQVTYDRLHMAGYIWQVTYGSNFILRMRFLFIEIVFLVIV